MARAELNPGAKRKIIEFDAETWRALHSLALDRMNTIQELVEDAVADLLKKHGRPVTLKEALQASAPEAVDGRPPSRARKKALRAPGK
jgi:Antitoxin-like ribbon-helix-helix